MIENISEKLTNRLIRKNVIGSDERDIYQYGMKQLFRTVLNIVTTVMLGVILGELWQSLLFVSAFIIIRIYAGGYHASTPVKCYLLTSFIILAVLSVMKYIEIDNFICLGLLVTSSVIILFLSPVESENKPLDSIEKMIYRKKAFMAWGIEIFGAIAFMAMKFSDASVCIMMAQATLGLSQVIEKLKNKMKRGNSI